MKKNLIISLLVVFCLCMMGFFGCNKTESKKESDLTVYSTRIEIEVGQNYQIAYEYDGQVTFTSADDSIAAVSEKGLVSGVKQGQTFVEVKAGTKTKTALVSVSEVNATLLLDKENVSIVKSSEQTIVATVLKGGKVVSDMVRWSVSSDDLKIDVIGNSVKLKSDTVGYFTLTASYEDASVNCTVKVVESTAKRLATPSVSVVDCDTLNIEAVSGASAYMIKINDSDWQKTTDMAYSIASVSNSLRKGEFAEIYVKAVAETDFNYIDGEYSYLVLAHDYVDNSEYKDYDCTNTGTANFECTICSRSYQVEKYCTGHTFVEGVCSDCKTLQSAGISYEYHEETNSYWVKSANPSATPEETHVARVYNDGIHGELPVTDIARSAFANNASILKVYLPNSVTTIRREAFSECTNLQFISMPGVSLISDMQSVGGLEYNHFLGCVSLTTVIVPGGFSMDTQVFNSYYQAGYIPQLDFYATDKVTINAKRSTANDMLSEKVYYYDETGMDCNSWRYGKNGEVVVNYSHNYISANGNTVCGKCGYQYDATFKYAYNSNINAYMVTGLIETNVEEISGIPATYNDGLHGELPVSKIGAGAFKENPYIKRVYLPETITALSGSTFESSNNLEYVSMPGITSNVYAENGDNHFMNCTKLKTVVLGESFTSNVKIAFVHPGPAEEKIMDIYLSSADGIFNCPGNNDLLTGNVYNYEETGKICNTWRYNTDKTDVILNKDKHEFTNGICDNCGMYLSNGVIYSFIDDEKAYCVTGYIGESTQVNILPLYNDGIHGEYPVIAIGKNAFEGKNITKLIASESIVAVGGDAFSQCYALTYVALPGWTTNTYAQEINGKTDHLNHFLFCGNLETVVLGPSFTSNVQVFVAAGDQTSKKLDIYLTSKNGTFTSGGNAGLLSGNVYHYDKDGACGTWKYNEDKTSVILAPSHEYEDGLCTNCGALQTEGVVYTPSGDNYVVTGYTGSASEVYIAAKIDNKPVVAIGKSAFGGKAITKLVAPKSVIAVGCNAFSQCYSLQYVALPGWTNSNNNGGVIENEAHYNQFYACGKLETLIVGESFTTIHQTFVPESGQGQVTKVYLSSSDGTFVRTGPDNLLTDVKYYYSESQPTDTEKTYWHYDINGDVVLWN